MKISQIYIADLLNGEGLRNCYFYTSCEIHCPNCFNKELWETNIPQSRTWTKEDFEKMIKDTSKPYISGITLLGGDPFHPVNRDEILGLCKEFKKILPDKTIWIYTGYTWETLERSKDSRWECLKYIDVLCEGPYIDSLKSPSKPWVGSENQRVINVPKSLEEGKVILYC